MTMHARITSAGSLPASAPSLLPEAERPGAVPPAPAPHDDPEESTSEISGWCAGG